MQTENLMTESLNDQPSAMATLGAAMEERNLRKLVSVRTVDNLEPIEGADLIELAVIGGWKVVVKKGDFKPLDQCVYFEIDCFLPDGNPAWQFLVDKSSRLFQGVKGHKLRTIKLRGQISQGLILPIDALPVVAFVAATDSEGRRRYADLLSEEVFNEADTLSSVIGMQDEDGVSVEIGDFDFASFLGIVKWEAELPACLAGQAQGLFPSFIRKTDQERCQNLVGEIFGYDDRLVPFDQGAMTDEVVQELLDREVLIYTGNELAKILPAKADRNARYEITMKLDGSSTTFFHRDGEVGVCSRNLQLKISDENAGNSFVRMLFDSGLDWALPQLGNLAIQGELMGPGIQGNRENLKQFEFFVFDVQLIDEGRNMTANERMALMNKLVDMGVNMGIVHHAPVFDGTKFVMDFIVPTFTLDELGIKDVAALLKFVEGPSLNHAIREGDVFKRDDGKFSFKGINNLFLAKEKE
jgi:RNA ligase (TIGR02306 family)